MTTRLVEINTCIDVGRILELVIVIVIGKMLLGSDQNTGIVFLVITTFEGTALFVCTSILSQLSLVNTFKCSNFEFFSSSYFFLFLF